MEISIKRISYLSSFGFLIVFALACASSGCAVREDVSCTLWSGCDEDMSDDDVEQPRDTFDPDFPDEVDPTPETEVPSDAPNGPPETESGSDAPTCGAPTNPPVFSLTALPTITLAGGLNATHRLTVTAADQDVYLKKLTFYACSTSPSGEINSPALREVGMGSDLLGVADIARDPAGCGTGNSLYQIRVVLDTPFAIAAGQSRTLDLRVIALAFQSGESLTTAVDQDLAGPVCGSLSGTCAGLGIAGTAQNLIWSHDLTTWHNGDSIDWNLAGAQTLTRP